MNPEPLLTGTTGPGSVVGRSAIARISVLLPLLLLLALPDLAQAQFEYSISNGTVTITGYTGSGGDVVIPDTIGGLPVTTIRYDAFSDCTGLTSVTIGNGVSSIGEQAFSGCTGLTAITVDALNPVYSSLDGVVFDKGQTTLTMFPPGRAGTYTISESVTGIGHYAFSDCTSLTSITIPDSVTSIGAGAFSSCSRLSSVTIPDGVTSIGGNVFYGCTSLTSVGIPDGVTRIGDSAFYGCRSLSSVTIPDGVTRMGIVRFTAAGACPASRSRTASGA